MAITIAFDKVNGAQAMVSARQGDRVMLIGRATGLTNANTTPRKALVDAIKAALQGTDAIPPTYPHDDINATLSYVTADGETQTSAIVRAYYETPTFGGSPIERFAVEDVTNLVNEPTQLDPTTGAPLLVSITSDAPDFTVTNTTKLVSINYPQTWRVLALYGLFSQKPSAAIKNLAKKVNAQTWQGLGVGYWRCEGPRVRWSSRDYLYAVSITVVTRGDRDWSTYSIAEKDGEFVRVDPAVMTTLWAQPYAVGIRYQKNGVLKDGPFATANFGTALDPLIDDTPLSSGGGFDNLAGV